MLQGEEVAGAATESWKSQRHVESVEDCPGWSAGRSKVFLFNLIGRREPLKVLGASSMILFQVVCK